MLQKLFIASFGKLMIATVLILTSLNGYLCYQNKSKQQRLAMTEQAMAQLRTDNQQLHQQIVQTQQQILAYQRQTKQLQQTLLTQLKHAEERKYALLNALDNHQNWANQPVPERIGRLFNQRATISNHQTAPAAVSRNPTVPQSNVRDKN